MIRTILIGLLVLMILVTIHERGHFTAARKCGVKVLEFGLGIPPKVKTMFTDKKGTKYTLNALPLGGFVQLKGENPEDKTSINDKDSILNVNIWKKTIILLGGIIMNILLAWVVFAITFMIGIKPLQIIPDNMTKTDINSYLMPSYSFAKQQNIITENPNSNTVSILGVQKKSLADKIGLQEGYEILSIDNQKVSSENLGNILQNSIGKQVNMDYKNKKGEIINTTFTCPEDTCLLGVIMQGNYTINEIKPNFFNALGMAGQEIQAETKITFNALGGIIGKLFSGNKEKIKESTNALAGPVGAMKVGETFAKTNGFAGILAFMAMISLALAIFNLLPIPALDGGRLLSMRIQTIFNLPKEKYFKIEGYVNFVFFIALMGLGILIILQDLSRFWSVKIPFFG